ncbi:MAG: hypothetical protein AB8G11_23405 [Saprospiraceae bacterium]
MRITILIIGLLLGSITSYSQFTQTDSVFFTKATENFESWLMTITGEHIHTDGFENRNDKIALKLTIDSRIDWISLRSSYYDFSNRHIGEQFLHQMSFLFELPLDSLTIQITSLNEMDHYTTILEYVNGKFSDTDILPLDIKIKGNGDHPIAEMVAFSSAPIIAKNKSKSDIKLLKEQIIDHFEGHYESKEQWFGRDAVVNVLEIDNEFSIEVTNISKEVLDDFTIGYFELIIIDVFIQEKDQNVEIVYNFRAKYGSGIFIAPRRSGYVDMNGDYTEYVRRYDKKVRKMIVDVATATPIKN